MRNTIRMYDSARCARTPRPTTTLAIEDNNLIKPPNGLIAISERAAKHRRCRIQHEQSDHQPV